MGNKMSVAKKIIIVSIAAIAALNLTACSMTAGVKPDASVTSTFRKGVTTESEVTARLGTPEQTMSNMDGSRTVMYHYEAGTVSPLGLITGTADKSQAINTLVTFDRNGKFVGLTQMTGNHSAF